MENIHTSNRGSVVWSSIDNVNMYTSSHTEKFRDSIKVQKAVKELNKMFHLHLNL